jgi:hypothetical protein
MPESGPGGKVLYYRREFLVHRLVQSHASYVRLAWIKNTLVQQVENSTAVHLALQVFTPVDITLGLTIAPAEGKAAKTAA